MSENYDYVKDVEESIAEELNSDCIAEDVAQNTENCICEEAQPEQDEYEENCPHPHGVTCTRVHAQAADVSLPVKIKPYARMGVVQTRCCGEPAITMRHCPCPENGCDMVITQTICARIPIEYGVNATSGEATITCRRMGETK